MEVIFGVKFCCLVWVQKVVKLGGIIIFVMILVLVCLKVLIWVVKLFVRFWQWLGLVRLYLSLLRMGGKLIFGLFQVLLLLLLGNRLFICLLVLIWFYMLVKIEMIFFRFQKKWQEQQNGFQLFGLFGLFCWLINYGCYGVIVEMYGIFLFLYVVVIGFVVFGVDVISIRLILLLMISLWVILVVWLGFD